VQLAAASEAEAGEGKGEQRERGWFGRGANDGEETTKESYLDLINCPNIGNQVVRKWWPQS